jgi:vacuolar-type H+-ATPase subunit E/Vma4
VEAAQKGRSYEKMQLDHAKDKARLEAARIYKNRLQSARDKMVQQVEDEIRKERDMPLPRGALPSRLA